MNEKRFVLQWTVEGQRHAFCPAGGLTRNEIEAASDRLHDYAAEQGVEVDSSWAEYAFDVREWRPPTMVGGAPSPMRWLVFRVLQKGWTFEGPLPDGAEFGTPPGWDERSQLTPPWLKEHRIIEGETPEAVAAEFMEGLPERVRSMTIHMVPLDEITSVVVTALYPPPEVTLERVKA